MDQDKKKLSEEDIKHKFITPAIENSGWGKDMVLMEYYFTDGRVVYQGGHHGRKKGKKADYMLFTHKNNPLAIVEAKDNNHSPGAGMQQAIEYAQILDIPFAYSSNGDEFVEHDMLTGNERTISLEDFPSPQELQERFYKFKNYTPEEESVVEEPYYWDNFTNSPRYYQRVAINRTVEAVARGANRALVVMATGTGKTFTAFQIIHRLTKSGKIKKVLFLADRNILVDQTMAQDFRPFGNKMAKVQNKQMDSAYDIFMALYQQLVSNDEDVPDPFRQLSPDFFNLIIVDECHRGSAKEDSEWRKILDYFSSAVQVGMTATPKSVEGANNIDYFGEPLYTYSLAQGIEDGFLAPYRVTNSFLNVDLTGYVPAKDEKDIYDYLIKEGYYSRKDFGRRIAILKRREIVARRITKMLHSIGRMTKTIVFCVDVDEAEALRHLLTKYNADMCRKDPRYVMRITGDDMQGKKQLDNFIDPDQPYPTVVTTSQLLSTGVDCKTCGMIVIDKEISSMTEFKQIIGRGTRLRPDKGKWHFEILDFRNATVLFNDPAFDGNPIEEDQGHGSGSNHKGSTGSGSGSDDGGEGDGEDQPRKYYVAGTQIRIEAEIVQYLDGDGKLIKESVASFARKNLRGKYGSIDSFIEQWKSAHNKSTVLDELKEYDVLIDNIRDSNPMLKDADAFDIICHVAFDAKPLTRRERANNVRKRDYLNKYQGEARKVLEILLEKYAENGILELENKNILELSPLDQIGKPSKICRLFGGPAQFFKALEDIKGQLYDVA